MKLNKRNVAALRAPTASGRQELVWDDDLTGLGVLLSGKTKKKTYVVQRSIGGRKRRVTIGDVADYDRTRKKVGQRWLQGVELARVDAARVVHNMRLGVDPKARDGNEWTLADALTDYVKSRPNLSERSRADYRTTITRYFKQQLDSPLADLTPDLIESKMGEIAKRAARNAPRSDLFVSEPGSATANGAMRVLRAVYNHAAARSDLRPWPRQRLRGRWHRVDRRERSVKFDDLPRFHDTVEGLGRDDRDAILMLLYTGLRVHECLSLRWSYVDFTRRSIRLPARATKTKRALDLPTSDLVHRLLSDRRALGQEGEFVFPSAESRSGHRMNLRKPLLRVGRELGVEVNAHALRSTFITIAENTPGLTPVQSRALVNHAVDVQDVHGGYVNQVELKSAAQAVARHLKKLCKI